MPDVVWGLILERCVAKGRGCNSACGTKHRCPTSRPCGWLPLVSVASGAGVSLSSHGPWREDKGSGTARRTSGCEGSSPDALREPRRCLARLQTPQCVFLEGCWFRSEKTKRVGFSTRWKLWFLKHHSVGYKDFQMKACFHKLQGLS